MSAEQTENGRRRHRGRGAVAAQQQHKSITLLTWRFESIAYSV